MFTKIKNKFDERVNNKITFMYIGILFLISVSYMFLLNSNNVFQSDVSDKYKSELFEIKTVENIKVELRSRKYDEKNHTVEFYFYAYDNLNNINSILEFDIRERENPFEKIEVTTRRIDENNYIVRAVIPNKNWDVLSITVNKFNPLEVENENNSSLAQGVKFYSSIDEMQKENNLIEKSAEDYLIFGIEIEIDLIKESILENKNKIEILKSEIIAYEENKVRLSENKAYQTENEQKQTDNDISNVEFRINENLKKIDELDVKNEENSQKIKVLELKIRDLKGGN